MSKSAFKTMGSAFPSGGNDGWSLDRGVTMRDWMAAQALIGMGMWCPDTHETVLAPTDAARQEARAKWAYAQADAMLAQSVRPPV